MKCSQFLMILSVFALLSYISCSGGKAPLNPAGNDLMDILLVPDQADDIAETTLNDSRADGLDAEVVETKDVPIVNPDSIDVDGSGIRDIEGTVDGEGTVQNCPGNPGCDCKGNSDCYSGFCIETANGHKCSGVCDSDSSCDDGYKCSSVTNTGGDTAYICIYKFPKLCLPCKADSDCTTNSSVTEGSQCVAWVPETDANGNETGNFLSGYGNAGAFCGTPCDTDADCATGYKCKMAESITGTKAKQCVLSTGSCGCTDKAARLQSIGKCYVRNELGTCEGTQQCGTDKTMGTCSAKTPKAEVCNHEDDNCNGRTDEGIDMQTDVNNCGQCGIKCTNDHGDTKCEKGKCQPSCATGFWDCDGDKTNGCEGDLSVLDTCGRCNGGSDCPNGFFCTSGNCIKKYSGGHSCDTADDCAGGICTDEGVCCGQACDGPCQSCKTGTCTPVAKDGRPETDDACSGFLCDGAGACLTKCQGHNDCLDAYFCEEKQGDSGVHTCKPDMGLGGDCKNEGFQACKNNICADGVCCENTCSGTCKQCNAQGKCEPVISAEDPDTCSKTKQCDENGNCLLDNGQVCGAGADCLNGICKDGFCCDTACDGPCEKCTANGCEPVKGMDDAPECTGDKTCNANGKCVLKAGQTCNNNADCATGECKADYDGTGKWCGEASQCFHDGTAYADGNFSANCWDTTNQAQCESGVWTKQGCGTSGCNGSCGTSTNGCQYHVKTCTSGQCVDTPDDVDGQETMCRACGLDWAIGGNIAATSCCGDDPGEYPLACKDSSANGDCGNDSTACCKAKSDCVDHLGNCTASGKCYVFGSGNKRSFCDNNQWQDPDESQQFCTASGCGYTWLANASGTNSKCCGDDPGEDFVQSAGRGRQCCYNGRVMASGATSGSILCTDGRLYDCNNRATDDSGVAITIQTCGLAGGLYCSADNTWKYGKDNACSCSLDSTCLSGACKQDFDRSGAWCAASNQCMHNAQAYNSGTFADTCYDGTSRTKCVNGMWNPVSCGSDTNCTHFYCTNGGCRTQYKNNATQCNSAFRCSSGIGNNNYNHAGTYRCQGYCDGAGHCDYAGNCDNCINNFAHASGTCSSNTCVLASCNWGYANCSGGANSSCETLLNNYAGSCTYAGNIDQVCGDSDAIHTGPGKYARGNKWYKIYVKECNSNWFTGYDLYFTAKLTAPSTANYDLRLYDSNCSTLLSSSSNAGNGGTETVSTHWKDQRPLGGHDDSKWLYLHIIYHSGSSCDNWHLTTTGGK